MFTNLAIPNWGTTLQSITVIYFSNKPIIIHIKPIIIIIVIILCRSFPGEEFRGLLRQEDAATERCPDGGS